jgi:hypothetical protein
MDAKEFRSLQEAYNQVCDESYKDLGDKARDKGHQLLNKSKKTATRGNMYAGTKPSNTPEGEKLQNRASKQFAVSAFHNPEKSQAKAAANKERGEKKKKAFGNRLMRGDRQGIHDSYDYDIYDIILSHLLDEGYAETPEAAEAIMVNMSEEWREDIMEKEDSEYEKASDAALDKRYGYGRASGDKRSFGRAANRSSAAAALRALRRGERSGSGTSTEAGADAVHQGWAKTAKTSTDQTPEKKERRSKLANTEYKDLPDDEKEKDRVSFNAVKATYKNRNR